MKKCFLLGFHDESYREVYKTLLQMDDAQVTGVGTVEEMVEQARLSRYDVYVMDLNLGFPGGRTILPAQQVYDLIKPHLEHGTVFLGYQEISLLLHLHERKVFLQKKKDST